jgi:general secretion pathway protein M
MIAWWSGRTPREQAMLAIMGALLALFAVWFLIVAPLGRATERAQAREARAAASLAAVEAAASEIEAMRAGRSAASAAAVRTAAEAAGVTLTSAEDSGDGTVTAAVEAAQPAALFAWLATLEREQGVAPRQLSVGKNPDGTVSAEMLLAGAAP